MDAHGRPQTSMHGPEFAEVFVQEDQNDVVT